MRVYRRECRVFETALTGVQSLLPNIRAETFRKNRFDARSPPSVVGVGRRRARADETRRNQRYSPTFQLRYGSDMVDGNFDTLCRDGGERGKKISAIQWSIRNETGPSWEIAV